MKINRLAVAAVCSKAWGRTPREFWAMRERGELTLNQVASQCYLEMMNSPMAAETFMQFVLPEDKAKKRQSKHASINAEAYEALKAMRDRQKKKESK